VWPAAASHYVEWFGGCVLPLPKVEGALEAKGLLKAKGLLEAKGLLGAEIDLSIAFEDGGCWFPERERGGQQLTHIRGCPR